MIMILSVSVCEATTQNIICVDSVWQCYEIVPGFTLFIRWNCHFYVNDSGRDTDTIFSTSDLVLYYLFPSWFELTSRWLFQSLSHFWYLVVHEKYIDCFQHFTMSAMLHDLPCRADHWPVPSCIWEKLLEDFQLAPIRLSRYNTPLNNDIGSKESITTLAKNKIFLTTL